MSDWETCAVPQSFVKSRAGRQHQILAGQILEQGRYPVIDQGQSLVAGYCDDAHKLIDFDLPLVIFGDHTRCFKYVDFPFVLGADGTKLLVPERKRYDPKFYYFALLSLNLPSRGYNRHFKLLKERILPLPPLLEQRTIAHVLSIVQKAVEQQERIIAVTTELKKALMHKLFTEGLRGERQKETEIGLVPESWEVVPLGSVTLIERGKFSHRPRNEPRFYGGDYPFGNSGDSVHNFRPVLEQRHSGHSIPATVSFAQQKASRSEQSVTGADGAPLMTRPRHPPNPATRPARPNTAPPHLGRIGDVPR